MSRMMSRGFFTASFLVLAAGQAQAVCMQPQPVRVCTEFFHSGERDRRQNPVGPQKSPIRPIRTMSRAGSIRSPSTNPIAGRNWRRDEIYTGNDETKFTMEVGKSYLLFINKNQQARAAPDNCGNSSELSKADTSIKAIDAILKAAASGGGADIGGRVMLPLAGSQAISDAGAPGVGLKVENYVGRDQTVSTDQQGHFDNPCPPPATTR